MAQVLQDSFAGTAGQNVYLRAGWSEYGWTAAQRAKFVIDSTGLLMQMVGSGANAYADSTAIPVLPIFVPLTAA